MNPLNYSSLNQKVHLAADDTMTAANPAVLLLASGDPSFFWRSQNWVPGADGVHE